jgi:hypothetical protein
MFPPARSTGPKPGMAAAALPSLPCLLVATVSAPGAHALDAPAASRNVVGYDTAIAVGSDGLPVISYRDVTAGALKVAKCANGACTGTATITTVDGPLFADGFEVLPP